VLANAARHSHASSIEVTLRSVDGGIQLAVCDNGVGFDPKHRSKLGRASATPAFRERAIAGHLKSHVADVSDGCKDAIATAEAGAK